MKQIVDKLNKIAKKIDGSVEIPQTDLIIDSLDAITKAYGGTPNDSNLIVDKLEDIAGVAHSGITPSGNIEITENTAEGEPLDISQYATATVNVAGGGGSFNATLLPEATYSITREEQGVSNSYYIQLDLVIPYSGDKIIVLFNDTEYECVGSWVDNDLLFGAPLVNNAYDYSIYPFNITFTMNAGTFIRVENSGNYTVELAYPVEPFHVTVTTDVENAYLGYTLTIMGSSINTDMPLKNATYIIEGVGGLALVTPYDSQHTPITPSNLVNCVWNSDDSMLIITGDNASFTVNRMEV